jgi:hypothetical protein
MHDLKRRSTALEIKDAKNCSEDKKNQRYLYELKEELETDYRASAINKITEQTITRKEINTNGLAEVSAVLAENRMNNVNVQLLELQLMDNKHKVLCINDNC